MKYIAFLFLSFLFLISTAKAQLNFNYWDINGYFQLGLGMIIPNEEMKSTRPDGLCAKTGIQGFFDFNVLFTHGFGVGFMIEGDEFNINKTEFIRNTQVESMDIKNSYTSSHFGLNLMLVAPYVITKPDMVINFYLTLNPSLGTFNIPDIDMYYNPNQNKYVKVEYRSYKNTQKYIGGRTGIQVFINDDWGINLSYNKLFPTMHIVKNSVKSFDSSGNFYEIVESKNYYLGDSGWQLGFIYRLKYRK